HKIVRKRLCRDCEYFLGLFAVCKGRKIFTLLYNWQLLLGVNFAKRGLVMAIFIVFLVLMGNNISGFTYIFLNFALALNLNYNGTNSK
ncbi:MAG: hypothetical protein K2O20_04240, partial [Duncaniella sp.]|nr:hypothetical protein [Duncaniella sp.]